MAIYTTSQTFGFTMPNSNDVDIVAAGVTISDTGANDVVHGFFSAANVQLVNFGSILGTASGFSGVDFEGNSGSIFNADGAMIAGYTGVLLNGDNDSLTNNGVINGINTGVLLGASSDNAYVLNHGYIHGGAFGVSALSNTDGAMIFNTGTIDTDGTGVFVNTAAGALVTEIVNSGTIHGALNAIQAAVGAFSLVNQGTLIGDVIGALSVSADSIVNSGKIAGSVHLGGGNDTFNGAGGTSGAIFGQGGADRLTGGAAGDRMDGGDGNDTLTGGAGADHFVFSTALVGNNVDRIADFKHGTDKFDLDHAIFGAAGAAGTGLSSAAFFMGAHAHDADDRIIYNPTNGFVLYDSNGSGAGHEVHFATLAHNLSLSQVDFLIV